MAHTCEACGQTFETMTRLRLHDCPAAAPAQLERDRAEFHEQRERASRARQNRALRLASREFHEALVRTHEGDETSGYQLLAYYERDMDAVADSGTGDAFWDLTDGLAERVVTALDAVVRDAGWPVLREIVDAYDPETDRMYPYVSHVVTNVTGRFVIRTRRSDGVAAIPERALTYLSRFDAYQEEDAWLESQTYGWGVGHPDVPFVDTLSRAFVDGNELWTTFAIEQAFYADQHAAVDILADLLREDAIDDDWLLLQSVAGPTQDESPVAPRWWDWDGDPPTFTWDPTVEKRVRTLVEETGLDRELPADWTFDDLSW